MKIKSVRTNGRRRAFEVETNQTTYLFPYAKCEPLPNSANPVVEVFPDPEMGLEGFTYQLKNGKLGSIHLDAVREVNRDPEYMADLLMYKLSLDAQQRFAASGITAREIARELGTSPAQLYRLLDQTNYTKSFRQLVLLLNVLGCDVGVRVTRSSGQVKRFASAKDRTSQKNPPTAPVRAKSRTKSSVS